MNIFAHVHGNVLFVLAIIYGILLFASAFVFLLQKKNPQKNYLDLKARIQSWWVMIGVFSAVFVSPKWAAISFLALLSFLALKEFFHLVPARDSDRRVRMWAYLSIPLQYYWVATGWYNLFIILIPVYFFLLIPMRMVIVGETQDFLKAAGITQWGLMITVYALGHLSFFYALPEQTNPNGGAAGLLLFLIFMTQFNDVAQYVWGKSLGKRKIIPKVSPNKTLEGFIGGMLTTMFAAWYFSGLLTPIAGWKVLLAGFIVSAMGFIGDVVMSAVKRDIGVKDTGSLIPGHGGILDRVDSLTYTAPLFFHFIKYFYA